MLCFSGFELYRRWVPLICITQFTLIDKQFSCQNQMIENEKKKTPIFKLTFSKTDSHFPSPIFLKQTPIFEFKLRFFENKLRFSTKQTPIFQVKLKCPFKLPYIYPSRRNKRVVTSIHRAVSAPTGTVKQACLPRSFIKGNHYFPDVIMA